MSFGEHIGILKMSKQPPFDVRVEWYSGDITIEKVIKIEDGRYWFDPTINGSHWAITECCTILEREKWIFKVLEGAPKAETYFSNFDLMKVFSAHLSALYPDIVTTYEKVE